ncbi:male sterility domain-containing protein [Aspergillus saccharolyticus JOP 1030-1]|uniref:Fatty acyl-CoA reductase n=1 Tax=Aspergillus saccharolyticus JOP 1030-1 TaxID=1450539 RepID=A0A318ZPV5_9EURO|nr:male sterility domain-containing protein [Aspergillus saccharolyticus JOP 1030-1]PYH48574.1 male sterility domain-containing protein [Aspergillus saccharolyticus JOP 1030-1]
MWEAFSKKVIVITGGSGFLGTVLAHRIVSSTNAARVYVISRSDTQHVHRKWEERLALFGLEALAHDKITIIQGNTQLPNMGMAEEDVIHLQRTANFIIHAASSINLKKPLPALTDPVIRASLHVADFALGCANLIQLAFVSTAYVNAFLYWTPAAHKEPSSIEERIYPLSEGDPARPAITEWHEVEQHGSSWEYKAHAFPAAYTYAKHLTERLLLERFRLADVAHKLLIMRPSSIGPAQGYPCPGFSFAESAPVVAAAAALLLAPFQTVTIPSSLDHPDEESLCDEVPVDVVAERILAHLACGTAGIVHAVAGEAGQMCLGRFWAEVHACDRMPWQKRVRYVPEGTPEDALHPIARVYNGLGMARLAFADERTVQLERRLREAGLSTSSLFLQNRDQYHQLAGRAVAVEAGMRLVAHHSRLLTLMYWVFYARAGWSHFMTIHGSEEPSAGMIGDPSEKRYCFYV